MNIMDLVCELEDELVDKRSVFGKRDFGRFNVLIRQLKEILPAAFEESNYIISKQQQILKNADTVAKNTIRASEERAEQIVGTTDIMRKSEEEAKKLLEKTAAKCDLLVKKTKEHLDAMFVDTEQYLLSSLSMIRANREELRGAMLIKTREG